MLTKRALNASAVPQMNIVADAKLAQPDQSELPKCGHSINRVTVNDLPWVLSLAYNRYRSFDPGKTLLWLLDVTRHPTMLFIRTTDSFCIATVLTPAWHPQEHECHVLFLCSDVGKHWQAVSLLRETIAWAKEHKCVRFWVSSETEFKIDALAKRVGARATVVKYQLDL